MVKGNISLIERFQRWDENNPEVYELFKRFTFEAIAAGRKKSSAWLIVNRIRWETSVVTKGEDFKISNDFIALYSRKFMNDFTNHAGFFVTKITQRF